MACDVAMATTLGTAVDEDPTYFSLNLTQISQPQEYMTVIVTQEVWSQCTLLY